MMTAIEMLTTVGVVLIASVARAALLLGVIAVFSVPLMGFAYAVRAVEHVRSHHHHGPRHLFGHV